MKLRLFENLQKSLVRHIMDSSTVIQILKICHNYYILLITLMPIVKYTIDLTKSNSCKTGCEGATSWMREYGGDLFSVHL